MSSSSCSRCACLPARELRFDRKLRLVYRRHASLSHAARAFLKVAESFAGQRKERYLFQPEH